MTVALSKHKLFYAAIPKVACTSIKRMFFEIENDEPFRPIRANGKYWHIHLFYPTIRRHKFPEAKIADYRRITIVRDPIKRFLSAYGNRVVHHNDVSEAAIKEHARFKRLKPKPELDEFIDRLPKYLAIPQIRQHCSPATEFVGEDIAYFDRVYAFHEIEQFVEDVSEAVEKEVTLGRFQTGGPKLDPDMLSSTQVRKLKEYYKRDYEILGEYL